LLLDLDDVYVVIRFVAPGEVEFTVPPDQLDKWKRIAEREAKTVDEVVKTALGAAFSKLEDLTVE
jgi:hypothetical protein